MHNSYEVKEAIRMQRLVRAGMVFFFYSLLVGMAIQLYIVPRIFPHLDRGDGIIILDSNGFNQLAKEKAEEIRKQGWGAWELRPQSHLPSGIASFFYTLLVPKPYTLLPFNALVHAVSGCLVLWLLRHIFSLIPALFGSFLFIVNPAALQWVAQLHRDGIFILGNLMMLVCVVQFWNGFRSSNLRTIGWGFIGGVAGTLLVWAARSYWVHELFLFVLLASVCLAFWGCSTRIIRKRGVTHPGFGIALGFLVLLLFQGWLIAYHSIGMIELPQEAIGLRLETAESSAKTSGSSQKTSGSSQKTVRDGGVGEKLWNRTTWLPEFAERKLYHLSVARRGVISTGGNTVVDSDIPLNSAGAFVTYLPRALQLGLLSPLPELWRGQGSTPAMTMARKVMGVTTFFFYFCLLGLLVGIVLYRKNQMFWLICLFCFMGILIFTYTYPNVGTLLRFRYGFYMLLVAVGAANILEMGLGWRRKRHALAFVSLELP